MRLCKRRWAATLALLGTFSLGSDSTGEDALVTYDEVETEEISIPPSNYTTGV